jgi:hypothetical protein
MTDDPVAAVARAAADQLAAKYGPRLAGDVEAALHERGPEHPPTRYLDPVELGSLIVSIASLAWTIYSSRKSTGQKPTPQVLAREIRIVQRERSDITGAQEEIIEVVATEIVRIDTNSDL